MGDAQDYWGYCADRGRARCDERHLLRSGHGGWGTAELGGTSWFATGLTMKPGATVTVTAQGFWQTCQERTCMATPDGIGVQHVNDCTYIAPDLSAFSLIARVGDDSPSVIVGIGPTTIRFAINDCYFGDNTGGFTVTLTYSTDAVIVNPNTETTG
jgi:hypothetical protein